MYRSYIRIPQSNSKHILPNGHIETDPSTFSYFVTLSLISQGSTFDPDSSSVVRTLIDLLIFRSNPVSKVYQHRSRNGGILEVA